MKLVRNVIAAAAMSVAFVGGANASLTAFQTYTGDVGLSSDGCGSTTQSCTVTANVPAGATVIAAYLYTSTFGWNASVGGTFNGNAVAYTQLGANSVNLEAGRANVTGLVKAVTDIGPGGAYNFTVTETSSSQDGAALVVVYDMGGMVISTVGILDGFSQPAGDNYSIGFANPLNPAAPGFEAEMRLGIGFSCCSQKSTVKVNGITITDNAGNNDDSEDVALSNGNLITMGGDNDAFSPLNPTYDQDHERYNLIAQITAGDMAINVDTNNPSNDDNIFLSVFKVTGNARINPTPEPISLALVGLALAGLGAQRRFGKRS